MSNITRTVAWISLVEVFNLSCRINVWKLNQQYFMIKDVESFNEIGITFKLSKLDGTFNHKPILVFILLVLVKHMLVSRKIWLNPEGHLVVDNGLKHVTKFKSNASYFLKNSSRKVSTEINRESSERSTKNKGTIPRLKVK